MRAIVVVFLLLGVHTISSQNQDVSQLVTELAATVQRLESEIRTVKQTESSVKPKIEPQAIKHREQNGQLITGPESAALWLLVASVVLVAMFVTESHMEASWDPESFPTVMFKNTIILVCSTIAWYLVGWAFALGFNDSNHNAFIGLAGFFIEVPHFALEQSAYHYVHVFFTCLTAVLVCILVSRAVMGRVQHYGYMVIALFISGWIYPVAMHWTYSKSGWLSPSVSNQVPRLGFNGFLDFGGSAIIHVQAGFMAFVATWFLGARPGAGLPGGKTTLTYDKHKYTLGRWALVIGIMVLNGSVGFLVPETQDTPWEIVGLAFWNSALSGCFAVAVSGVVLWWNFGGKYGLPPNIEDLDAEWFTDCFTAGVIATSGCAPLCQSYLAVIMGLIAPGIYWACKFFLGQLCLDDNHNLIALHGGVGMWATLSTGLFVGDYQLNYVYQHFNDRFGWVVFGGLEQLGVQLIGMATIIAWCSVNFFVFLWLMERTKILNIKHKKKSKEEKRKMLDHQETDPLNALNISGLPTTAYDEMGYPGGVGAYSAEPLLNNNTGNYEMEPKDNAPAGMDAYGAPMTYAAPQAGSNYSTLTLQQMQQNPAMQGGMPGGSQPVAAVL